MPDYVVRPKPENIEKNNDDSENKIISCPCCGNRMDIDKVLENTTILRCSGCGMSDTRINS